MRKHTKFPDRVTGTAAVFLIAVSLYASQPVKTATVRPAAITGESWLTHLQRSFEETNMGKTGRLGPPPADPTAVMSDATSLTGEEFARQPAHLRLGSPDGTSGEGTVVVHGSDLYRMNCRGCHGEDGQGAPPEINSVINPVRATSAAAVMERMKIAGMEMSRAEAARLAQQSKAMLLARLHHGGQDMPAFPHISETEINSLIAYLRQLAGVRGAENEQLAVPEPRMRVGEHIAKSTCHICHAAAGPNPTPQQLMDGAIPPLSTLALRTTPEEFIRKVTQGAPITMGSPPELLRGRMPVFYYLTEEEASDIYRYLIRYPPNQWPVVDPAVSPHPDPGATEIVSTPLAPAEAYVPLASAARRSPRETANARSNAFPTLVGALVTLLLGLGFAFTVYEIRRLSANGKGVPVRKDAGV